MNDERNQIGRRGAAAHAACVLEVIARKAGNVHPGAVFADASWTDFVVSAQAVRALLDRAPPRGVGRTVLDGVQATRQVVGTNTNLGILLLLAPLCAVPDGVDLGPGVKEVLAGLTAEDAALVYQAIRLARPGGMGTADEADIASAAPASLLEAMALAAPRDAVARQYVTSFQQVFHVAQRVASLGPPLSRAIVTAHLEQMAEEADTLIRRKCGDQVARESQSRAQRVLNAGWPDTTRSHEAFETLDAWLREDGNRRNPGTSADLIAAGLYAALWTKRIRMPVSWHESLWGLETEEERGSGMGSA